MVLVLSPLQGSAGGLRARVYGVLLDCGMSEANHSGGKRTQSKNTFGVRERERERDTERERERARQRQQQRYGNREKGMCMYIYMCIHIHI